MKTVRALTTALAILVMTLCSFNGCSGRAQNATAGTLNASDADLQRDKRRFESAMEDRIAAFRRALVEMKARADHAAPQTKVEIDKHRAELERKLEVADRLLVELKASNNQALN